MASRKDLLKAHKFTTDRLVASLVDRDPDRLDSPLRKVAMGTFAGVMIGVLVMAGFGVFGLVTNGGRASSWKDAETAVIVDSQAGLVFWYTEKKLHPMENITSAKLASSGAEVTTLKTKSLKDVPRAELLGIRDAPRQLPASQDMGAYPIQACSTAPDGDNQRHTTLTLADPQLAAGDEVAVAVQGGAQDFYLVVDGIAHRVPKAPNQDVPPLLLEYTIVQPSFGLLNTLPQGSPLDAAAVLQRVPGVDEIDSKNPVGQARRVGQLVHVTGQNTTYVMVQDGLSQISPLEHKAIQVARPNAPSIEVTPDQAAQSLSPTLPEVGAADLPAEMPEVLTGQEANSQSLCATWTEPNRPPSLSTDNPTPPVTAASADPALADKVVIPPLRGALIRNEEAAEGPSVTLITEGRRFSVPNQDSLNALGYGAVAKDAVPAQVMGLIPPGLPPGQTLSIEAAQTESRPG